MPEWIFLILILLGIVAVPLFVLFLILKRANNRLMEQFGLLAIQYGGFVEARKVFGFYRYPFIRVSYRSRDLQIGSRVAGAGEHTVTYSFASVSVRPTGGKVFDIYKESFHTMMEGDWGDKDIRLGDAEFDKAFSIRASDEDFIKNVLNDEVKQKFLETLKKNHFCSIQLKDDRLYFGQAGLIRNQETRWLFESMIDLLYIVADRVDEVIHH